MLYPCHFPEISCIAAIEAQACRTPILTTDGYALRETVQVDHFKIPGTPGTRDYDQAIIERALALLNDPARASDLADQARRAAVDRYAWPAIVREWDRRFTLSLAARATRDQAAEPESTR